MATSKVTYTPLNFPNGKKMFMDGRCHFGTIAIAAGDYPATGLPISLAGVLYGAPPNPYFGVIYSQSSGYVYFFDKVNQSIRIYQSAGSAAPLAEIATTTPSGVVSDATINAMFITELSAA